VRRYFYNLWVICIKLLFLRNIQNFDFMGI